MQWWQAVPDAVAIGEVPAVTSLTHDSRRASPTTAFAAVPGGRFDGHDFLDQVIAAGAPACVVQASHEAQWTQYKAHVPLVTIPLN
jgi:UDP-N-acetylmuramyl pentapeptide synthase